jgi:ribosomal protein RSM22 (predicted rRNA methylase)
MQMPDALKSAAARALEGLDPQAVRAAAAALSARYRQEEKAPSGARLLRSPEEIRAYAAFRLPATFGAVSRALQMAEESGLIGIESLTDVGAGCGSALFAARAAFPQMRRAALVEREQGMIALGRELLREGLPDEMQVEWIEGDMRKVPIPPADLVTASFCLGELKQGDAEKMARRLWAAAGRCLLIVEPGTPAGFSRIRRYADILMGEGAHMAAPCPGMARCPLEAGDWCHFTVRVERTRLHRFVKEGELPYEDEKFSFLAVTRAPAHPARARIRRRPLIRSGYVELPLCRGDRQETIKITRSHPRYKQARKAETGDRWDAED